MEKYWITFSCGLCVFLLLFVMECLSVAEEEFRITKLFPDKSFSNISLIYGKNITCGEHKPAYYPSQTWTCNDIRVDGERMAYGLFPGIGVDIKCTETQGFDELQQLCQKMMEFIASDRLLWGAFVSNASCNYIAEPRVMLNMTLKGFEWQPMGPGRGWIESLQCMAVRKDEDFSYL